MDTSTIIIAVVLLAVCIIPMIFLNKAGKKKNDEE